MLIGHPLRIYLDPEPGDMRAGIDRLAARVNSAGHDLSAGHLFVFLSKSRTHLKCEPGRGDDRMPWNWLKGGVAVPELRAALTEARRWPAAGRRGEGVG
jgi:hypothetical protein